MTDEASNAMTEKRKPQPLPVDPEDRLDWEFYQPPPPKRRWTVVGRVIWKGRAKPLPVPDPEDE